MIGATVVSVATTLPEMIVSLIAASSGQVDMAVSNAVGSVTANTALILGLSLTVMPFAIDRKRYLKKSLLFIGSVILLWGLSFGGSLHAVGCGAMLLLFLYYIYESIKEAKTARVEVRSAAASAAKKQIARKIVAFLLGAGGVILGSRLLVDNGTIIARDILHVDERIISLTLIAIGTSLPELVTAVAALIKRRGSLSAGNIIGANIIDMLLILPLCSLIRGSALPIGRDTVMLDLPVCLLAAVILLIPALIKGRFSRIQGILSLTVYILYMGILLVSGI